MISSTNLFKEYCQKTNKSLEHKHFFPIHLELSTNSEAFQCGQGRFSKVTSLINRKQFLKSIQGGDGVIRRV